MISEEALFAILGDVYDYDEFVKWLHAKHPDLDATPYDTIKMGDGDTVVALAKQIRDGVYL